MTKLLNYDIQNKGHSNLVKVINILKMKYKLKKQLIQAKKNNIIEVDNFVVGAGIGGTYLSSRLLNIFPNQTILQVDKLSDYGGVQTSSNVEGSDTYIELGPIRFYESIHPRIAYLSEKYDLPKVEYLPDSTNQCYYLRGKIFNNENLIRGSEEVYNIEENEKNIDPFNTLIDNINEVIKENFADVDLSLLENRLELFKNKKLSNSTFQMLAQKNISQENWQRIQDILGYNDLISVKMNFLTSALETVSLSNKSSIQYRFKNGYSSLTKTIAEKNKLNKITINNLNKNIFNKNKYNTLFNTSVYDIKYSKEHKKWEIKLGKVNVNSPEDITYESNEYKLIYAKNIFSTIPLLNLKRIHNFSNEYNNICENNFVTFQIMRIYLRFDSNWLKERGIGYGKSITTLNGAQLIHYAENILMFYAFDTQGTKLFSLLPDKIQLQKQMITPTNIHSELIEECRSIIIKSYGLKPDELPKINGIAYSSWINTIRTLSGRNLVNLNGDSNYDVIMKIMFPYGQKGNFYVLENNSSFNAAWCEGSLEMVDFYFNLIHKQDLFGEKYIN